MKRIMNKIDYDFWWENAEQCKKQLNQLHTYADQIKSGVPVIVIYV